MMRHPFPTTAYTLLGTLIASVLVLSLLVALR